MDAWTKQLGGIFFWDISVSFNLWILKRGYAYGDSGWYSGANLGLLMSVRPAINVLSFLDIFPFCSNHIVNDLTSSLTKINCSSAVLSILVNLLTLFRWLHLYPPWTRIFIFLLFLLITMFFLEFPKALDQT